MCPLRRCALLRVSEDWLAVAIGLLLVAVAALGLVVRVPWPLFGWFS